MKLVIQIPCLDEEDTLPLTLRDLPRRVPGIDAIETLVIDDGSRDGTSRVAREQGVDRVVRLPVRSGLALAFARGLQEALSMGADVIVNTDGDHQYRGEDVVRLVQPILRGEADLVLGARDIESITHFSSFKKPIQRVGSRIVRWLSGCDVSDAASGFRAFHRDAACQIFPRSSFSHTLDTLMQAGAKGLRVAEIATRTNPQTRRSRLFRSTTEYLVRSAGTLIRLTAIFRPGRLFRFAAAGVCLTAGVLWVLPGAEGGIALPFVAGAGLLLAVAGSVADRIAIRRRRRTPNPASSGGPATEPAGPIALPSSPERIRH